VRRVFWVVILVGLLASYIWALESHTQGLLWTLVGLACGVFLASGIAAHSRRLEGPWAPMLMMFSGFLIWCGLCYWALGQGIDHGIWWPMAVAGGALVVMFSMLASPQYAAISVLIGSCIWALLSHSWGLLWAVVGGTAFVAFIVDMSMTRRPSDLFAYLWQSLALGSLIGIIVWAAMYRNWWLLLPWVGAALVFGVIGQVIDDGHKEDQRAELTGRQLRELRGKQDAALRPDSHAKGQEPAPDDDWATSSSDSYERDDTRND